MKILSYEDLPEEDKQKYKDIIEKFRINTIYYIDDQLKISSINEIDVEGYKIKMTKGLRLTLPIKQYFTIVLESKSRSNINEPYWNYRLYKLDKLLEN